MIDSWLTFAFGGAVGLALTLIPWGVIFALERTQKRREMQRQGPPEPMVEAKEPDLPVPSELPRRKNGGAFAEVCPAPDLAKSSVELNWAILMNRAAMAGDVDEGQRLMAMRRTMEAEGTLDSPWKKYQNTTTAPHTEPRAATLRRRRKRCPRSQPLT